jgi:hypothetical protein
MEITFGRNTASAGAMRLRWSLIPPVHSNFVVLQRLCLWPLPLLCFCHATNDCAERAFTGAILTERRLR